MSNNTSIEWTESTWNPVTGCTKVSPGCKNCYAERMAKRLQAMGQPNYKNGFRVSMHAHALSIPSFWKKPQMVFVNSMSDLFHKAVPEDFILNVFDVMCRADQHIYQVLTKRSDRLLQLDKKLPWKNHIWMGVSVENQDCVDRIEHLRKTNARVKFLSLEPLLAPIRNLNLKGIDWVIVGGESGPKARIIDPSWVIDIRNQCVRAKVPFFFKQWGGFNKKKTGRELEGRIWSQMPKVAAM
ncbi:MAG: phage Gp37/Gp68 family protein [Deltaproteobacteria bacterium]|nr:phage Gp37/Gp68 family protein [Deltaproteobacteria bacterium]